MKLDIVTFSGGSNNCDIDRMLEISEKHPFVEWGIQTPHSPGAGGGIFPNAAWVKDLTDAAEGTNARLCAHLCSVHNLLNDGFDYMAEAIVNSERFQRFQLNTHGHPYQPVDGAYDVLARWSKDNRSEFLIQVDHKNDDFLLKTVEHPEINASAFFDTSMGAGWEPTEWPVADTYIPGHPDARFGYSGGLGPGEIQSQLDKMAKYAGDRTIWIDMEGKIQSWEKGGMDLDKCQQVIDEVEASGYLA